MKICKKCGDKFKIRVIVDGKERNLCSRKYCLECSPFGKHNTLKLNGAETRHLKHQHDLQRVCQRCKREYLLDTSKGHGPKFCNSCRSLIRKIKLKAEFVALLGGRCSKCGYNKCIASLHFHHKNAEYKLFQLSGNFNRSRAVLLIEVKKCELICANCHGEEHFKSMDLFAGPFA